MNKVCFLALLSLLILSSSDSYPDIAGKYIGIQITDVYLGEQEQEKEFIIKQNKNHIIFNFTDITITLKGTVGKDGSFHVSGYEKKSVWDSILELEYEIELSMEIKGKYENRIINAYTFTRYVSHHPIVKSNPAILTGKLKGKKI